MHTKFLILYTCHDYIIKTTFILYRTFATKFILNKPPCNPVINYYIGNQIACMCHTVSELSPAQYMRNGSINFCKWNDSPEEFSVAPVIMKRCRLFSCRQLDSKETYLADVSTGCSSPPQNLYTTTATKVYLFWPCHACTAYLGPICEIMGISIWGVCLYKLCKSQGWD